MRSPVAAARGLGVASVVRTNSARLLRSGAPPGDMVQKRLRTEQELDRERARAGSRKSGTARMSRLIVCLTVLLLAACTPGADIMYGSSIRPGGGLPSITTMAVGRVGAQPAAATPVAPASTESA